MSFIVQPNSKESQSNSSKFKVNSCESMLIARKNNYDLIDIPSSGPYNAMYIKCQAINLVINKIKKSEISHIHDYILDENSVTYLPKQIALITSSSRYKSLMADQKLKTINDVNHIINIKQLNNNTISFSNDNASRQKISILAKGDFNHDAIEDIMLSVSNSVIGGSYTSYYLYILTKTEKDGDWIVLDEYPNN
ncbi:hypothetical protein VQ7734_01153 [Vibrio quintilis]|uniref:Uncharacterized protein n=2 Tax=Vibrio quintilis TaxID=1117707 RepID=A0A1M7YS74_9VIBR|nr:hypothetical protein VQ7734_01153 [Vibrio quintilis]